ncbi:hypothetical protein JD844_020517 [Phrynosoma platyrhinos]|uniref:Calponin-homology (CH) domain-containing protein n=1 Tax=Phrynosoma platyrhinos TaxID=52577 RepID=A0ABQ7SSI5_PHRPL|nr:hypothetical protein JD844_020517 [Phrynosoma platyrhinos]
MTSWEESVIGPNVFDLLSEQESTQKRTFTSWVNSQLEKPREKGFNTFQCRSNIENALTYLKNRSIKLINIHVADIIEGKPSIVLGLIWSIILHFHIEELACTLAGGYGHPSVETPSATDNTSPTESPPAKRNAKVKERWKMSAKKALLLWAKEQCATHGYISVADFKSSWRNGLAFLAVINALRPGLVDMEKAKERSNQDNLNEAFQVAEKELNIPRLLEPEDVDVINPDEKSIMTYVAQFLQYFKSLPAAEDEMQGKVNETLSWLRAQEKKLTELLTETDNVPFSEKFQEALSFMETFDEEKKAFLPVLASKGKPQELSEDHLKMKEAWDNLTSQMNEWKEKLDRLLPPPLDAIESWLQDVEHQLAEDLPDSHNQCKATTVLEGKMRSLESLMTYFEQHLEALLSFRNRDNAGMPLVPPQKLEKMRRRFNNIRLMDFSILVEYYNLFCSTILEELISKLNIWHIKYGTKEMVESLLSDWHDFIEENGFVGQLETAFQICEEKKNRIISKSDLGIDPEETNKLFKMVESQISRCKEYISNVNETLQKNLSAWAIYTENIHLLKAWLEKARKEHPKKVPTETLAAWNSRHGSLNEAGNFLIECSNEEVGSVVSVELKKLNRKWAKLIKKTQFEMRLLRMQQEEMCLLTDNNDKVDSPTVKAEIDMFGHQVNVSDESLKSHFESMKLLPVSLCTDSLPPEAFLSEQEVKLHFEDTHKKLEVAVLKAMHLLGHETGPEGPMSKYEEAFSILDTSILGEFLKAAEQLKDISSAHEKAVVEEKSKDVRERWEAVHREIIFYVQLKMEIERGKLNKMFSKLNKQINKEKKLLSAGKTKGLLEEHEDMFSQQGRMGKLNACLQAMKTMSEKMAMEENETETKMLVAEYEQKKEDLQRRASAVYSALVSRACEDRSSKRGGLVLASANGERASSLHPYDEPLAEKALKSKGETSWKVFESMAAMLEKRSGEIEKPDTTEQSREELLREWNELQLALNKRMEPLKAVLTLVLPIENEWIHLCNSEEQLRKRDIPQCVLQNMDLPHKKVKKMQTSIANCIEWCNHQEQTSPTGGKVDPADWQAASTMIGEYKMQLEELDHKMQTIEAILQDLETFLRHVRGPVEASDPFSYPPELTEACKIQKEARLLDDRLTRARIRLEDPESGKKVSCKELAAALCTKEIPAVGSSEKEEVVQTEDVWEEFSLKNSELYKSLQDIHDKIHIIGLRDPTIPAAQQRLKLLTELRQELDCHATDMRSLNEMASLLSHFTKAEQEELKHQLEHCGRVMELLKQYHSCKNCLMSVILKQEHVLSQQVSYMGKENLQRITAKVNMAKQEFNTHSEDVDRINQICKNLQSQLNKIKSFEEPPFENEANAIVDRWLDISERTENYCDNLGRALALWDKLLNLSSLIDEWSNAELKNLEEGSLTEKELAELEAGLAFQEKNLEEFDTKVDEIQNLLNGSEPPLELQVIKSSLLNKMELIRNHLPSKSIPTELNGNTAELKGDLDLAKTQIGMTESLLKALSPSDTLEIFTKLEDLHQKILQQKHHVESLQKRPGCFNPEVTELKEQLKSVTDLFNSKKQIFQDHFTTLLNYHCKDFDDWFSSTQLSLEECCEPSETKEMLEEKIQRLRNFLTSEGKDSDIHEVKTLLSQVKRYLPRATVCRLSNWVRDKEVALQKVTSKCQVQEEKLCVSLQQFARLEDDFGKLAEWLNLQELQESQMEKPEVEHFYQTLLKQRESFDYFAWLTNSLRSSGFTCDQVVLECAQIVSRYKMLLSHVRKSLGDSQWLFAEEKNYEELAQSIFSWVQRVNEMVLGLSSEESKTPLEERICQIKEIVLLKEEGNAKIQNIIALGENVKSAGGSKTQAIQQMVSGVQNQWESTIQLAAEYLRHEEQHQHQRQPHRRRGDDTRAALHDSETQKPKISLNLGSQEMQSQLTNYSALQEEAEDLSLLLNELARQHSSLGSFTDGSFTKESLMALQQLHESLLNRLQSTAMFLEGHVEEHQHCKELIIYLRATLNELWAPDDEEQKQVQHDTLCQIEDTLQGIIAVVESLKEKIITLEQMCIKDEMDAPHSPYKKYPKIKVGLVEQEPGNVLNDAFRQDQSFSDDGQTLKKVDEILVDDEENSAREVLEGSQEGSSELKGSWMDAYNFPDLTIQSGKWLQRSGQTAADDNRLHELQQLQLDYQKKLQVMRGCSEMPPTTLPLMNGKIREVGPSPLSITCPSSESEKLCSQLEKQKAEATAAERSKSDPHNVASSRWDKLLQDLMAVKEVKQEQLHLVNNYQECFAHVQSSMKRLSAEKENLKIRGSMEDTVLLENIKKCLKSIEEERVLLNKLKTEQENLSRHLTKMDKALMQSQVDQVERWWKQMEDSLQRKQLLVAAEADEFKLFMSKAQDLQKLLSEQHHLRTGLGAPDGGHYVQPALMAIELQTLKHSVSLLRRGVEMQMKKIWSDAGKRALEDAMNDLQNQMEELEQLTPKEDIQIIDNYPQMFEITRKIEEAILWARVSELHLDEKVALFPAELLSQIQSCKALLSVAKEKEPAVIQLVDEARLIAPQLASRESSALSLLAHELQTCHQHLVLKLVQRVQQLEPQFEKRQKLFADVDKVQSQLWKAERMSSLDADEPSVKSELDQWRVISEKILQEVQEAEGLVDANYKDPPQGLNVFEQLFLNDYLRSFRSRAERALRLIQVKDYTAQNKIDTCEKFSEEIMALQWGISGLYFQCNELELDLKNLFPTNQEFKSKWNVLRDRAVSFLECLMNLDKYKEIWEFLDLKWDASCLDELQSQLCRMKNHLEQRVKHFENFSTECNRHQTALSEAEAIVSTIQRDCDALKDCSDNIPETNLISEKVLSWRVQHARYLNKEAIRLLDKNEALSASLKKAKMQEIKSLGAKIDGVTQMIQSKISTVQEKCQHEEGIQSMLNHSLMALKQIQSELQQPLLLDLEIQMIPCEKMYCEVLEDALEAECCAVEDFLKRRSQEEKCSLPDILGRELGTLQNLKKQLKADIAAHETFGTVRCYTEAVQKAADLLYQCEAVLSTPALSLDELEKESIILTPQKQEEFESAKTEVEALTSMLEKKVKQRANMICANLNDVKKVLQKALGHISLSYKEALEQSELSKVSRLVSTEEDLMKLRQDSGHLSLICKENDCVLMGTIVSTLWLKWIHLLNAAKEWEGICEEQNQEWKSINEEMERETIILDNLQEELPENPKENESSTKEELEELLECANHYKESVDAEKLLLHLILQRLRRILGVPESPPGKKGDILLVCEIQAMQERIKELCEKVQKQKDALLLEKEDRAKVNEEISVVKNSLQHTLSWLYNIDGETLNEKATKLEEIQRAISTQKQTLEQVMEKLRIKYTDMYTIVPVEIETSLEDCKKTLKDLEDKVSNELLKNSPHYVTDKKIEDINKGLQAIRNMLQQKSEDIEKAKEIQKRIWDLLDLWHYKMNELDSEVQDIVEQDPCQAQELMDRLMIPLQQYQQVSQLAERRTSDLNRAASKMEECDELLKSTRVWLGNTNHLLTGECNSDSAKSLNKHASALQMAFEDSEQKQSILSAIYPELEELSTLVETGGMVKELNNVNEQVKALQQKIMDVLPHVQHLADEVEAIESEVKTMEKDVDKIKTILSPSEDTLHFSPQEHLKHGQVILAHISPMQKALVVIQSYKENLRLPNMKMKPLCVFQRAKQLLKELKRLERITKEQNTLLEGEEMEEIKQQISLLCQKKEDILMTMKSSLTELHQQQDEPELEDDILESQEPEESGGGAEWQEIDADEPKCMYSRPDQQNNFLSFESTGSDKGHLGNQTKVMLSEIEQKVVYLLEDCKNQPASDSLSLQEEAETLSLKLRDVKLNLEKIQGMLHDKHAEEEVSLEEKISENSSQPLCFDFSSIFPLITSDRPVVKRPNGLQHQQELLSKLSEQSNLIDFIDMYMEKMQPQSEDSTPLKLQPSHVAPVSENELRVLTLKDQTGDKWQYLQEQLLCKKNPCHFELTEPWISTKINILPKGATSSVKTPTVEELKMYTAQLGNLSQEASVQIQKLFELLLAISRCLNNMEQMLSTCTLTSEEAPMQQMLYETLSAELQKLHADIGDKKEDLLKSITSAGGNPERFSQCFSSLQAWLQQTETATASRSKCMKADLDHYHNYENEIRQLYDELIEKKPMLQQSFASMSSHGISMPLQGLAELIDLGREKVIQVSNLKASSQANLQFHLQNHKQIKKNIELEKARYHQLVKEGKKLMELVNCPELESQVGKLQEQWAALSQKVDHELQRLECLLKLLSSYNRESKDLASWLALAQQRMNDWKDQSLNASQDLITVRNNVQSLLEFTKEIDEKSSLKSSVISTGNQLLLVKESDGAVLQSSLTEYEQKWGDLITQLPGIQERFHQNDSIISYQLQMAKLPSHEAITELTAWMNYIDQQRRNETTVDLQSPACQVKRLLKKYKEYLIEMNFKQWVVDYVNQSLLQMTTCDVKSKRYERTAFAERLGEMNLQWHKLQGSLNGKALENELAAKSKDVNQLKQNCAPVDYGIEASEDTVLNVSSLAELRAKVANQVTQLKTLTQSALEHWRIYDEIWGEVRLMLGRALYYMEHSKSPVITFETAKNQVVNLQFLQNETESNEEIWATLQTAADNLKKFCDPWWALINREIEDQLQKVQTYLPLWESYVGLYAEVTTKLDKHEEQCNSLLVLNIPAGCARDFLKEKAQDVKKLQLGLQSIKRRCLQVSELADKIIQLIEPTAQILLEKLQPLQRVSYLEKMLQMKGNEFQFGLLQLESFENCLEKLENHIKGYTEVLDHLKEEDKDSDQLMSLMLNLSALSPDMETLNEISFRLPLSDVTTKRLQSLNWQWSQKTAMVLEQCSELQNIQADDKEFLQQTEFISKLTMLKEQWQSVIHMAQKRKSEIDSLVKQWQKFTTSLQDLTKFLTDTNGFKAAVNSQDKYSLEQVRNLSHDFKNKQILLQRWQTRYSLTLDTGRKLLGAAAPEAKAAIQLEMNRLQENWDNTQLQVEKITRQLHSTIEAWENCERQVEELSHNIQKLKARIKDPLPVEHDELQATKEHIKDLEKSLANWNQKAKELGTKKSDLARYLLAEDVMVLKEQVQHLHRQWEELCLRVSLRKQEIEERLNAWIVFNEKNKELCAWLVQMESRVLQSADISIEDMIDKLEKDCMEEINMFSENKLVHLKQMGDQLIKQSNKSRAAEIDEKLNKINDRWQHLFDVIGGRFLAREICQFSSGPLDKKEEIGGLLTERERY